MSTPVHLVSIPTPSGFQTLAYDSLKLHPAVLQRINTLTNEQSWDEVRFGDVKDDARECRERAESLKGALLPFDPRYGVPEGYTVGAVVVYPAVQPAAPLPRVVRLNVAYGGHPPTRELYYYDKLPLVVLQRIENLKSEEDARDYEPDLLKVLYGDLDVDLGKDCFVDEDYLPGNEHLLKAKEERHAIRDAPKAARERLIEEAAVTEKVKWAKGVPKDFDVVLERSYACG